MAKQRRTDGREVKDEAVRRGQGPRRGCPRTRPGRGPAEQAPPRYSRRAWAIHWTMAAKTRRSRLRPRRAARGVGRRPPAGPPGWHEPPQRRDHLGHGRTGQCLAFRTIYDRPPRAARGFRVSVRCEWASWRTPLPDEPDPGARCAGSSASGRTHPSRHCGDLRGFGCVPGPAEPARPAAGFSSVDDQTLHYGTCLVEVPKSHKIGSTGSSWWRRLLARSSNAIEEVAQSSADRQSRCARRSDDTDARKEARRCFGRSDRRAHRSGPCRSLIESREGPHKQPPICRHPP